MMTQEEAIAEIKYYMEHDSLADAPSNEACQMAINALRPVSRETVEKVWKSEWTDSGKRDLNGVPKPFAISCKRCGSSAGVSWMKFCPNCGAPMTDEAVDMMLKRMEEMMNER